MYTDLLIGRVVHYYDKIGVAVILITGKLLTVGTKIKISGHDQEFEQIVETMQIDHKSVNEVKNGQEAGMKVEKSVKEGDFIYRIPDNTNTIE
jgi:hypothetical protein